MTTLLLASCLAIAAPGPAAAAPTCIEGRIADPDGIPLAGAGVVLLRRHAGELVHTRSDAHGRFASPELPPGAYWLVVERLGFEPEVRAFEVAAGESRAAVVTLTPLGRLAVDPAGRRELPWLVRGMTGDPLRSVEVGQFPAESPELLYRAVQGRVAWNALAGDAGADGADLVGSRAEVEMAGTIARDARWYVDGRLDDLEIPAAAGVDAADSGMLRYGVGYGESDSQIRFRGSMLRATRQSSRGELPGSLAERRASYAIDYRSTDATDDLDVTVTYRSSVADPRPRGPGEEGPEDERHAIWEGRGRYDRRLSEAHRLVTQVRVRAQQWSEPNTNLLADAVPQLGLLRDARFLEPRRFDAYLSEAWQWQLGEALSLLGGLDVAHASGRAGRPFVSPRAGGHLTLTPRARLGADASWVLWDDPLGGSFASETQAGSGGLGLRLSIENDLGAGGLVRVALLRNGYHDLRDADGSNPLREDYLLFALGPVVSHEVRVTLRGRLGDRVSGNAEGAVGSASGDLGLLPLSYARPGGDLRVLQSRELRFASATLGTSLHRTGTGIVVRYRWMEGIGAADTDYSRIDLEVDQELPWWELVGSRLDLLLAVRGYLGGAGAPSDGASVLAFEPSPLLAAGVGVRF